MDLLKEDTCFINMDGKEAKATNILHNKMFGIYFYASWCPASKTFTPKLADIYKQLVSIRKLNFEIICVSFDKGEEEMFSNMNATHANWWAVKYDDPLKEQLQTKYEIEFVPKLILISSEGHTITKRGRKEVEDRGVAAYNTWLAAADLLPSKVRASQNTNNEHLVEEQKVNDLPEPESKSSTKGVTFNVMDDQDLI